jgi:hypothetical protein
MLLLLLALSAFINFLLLALSAFLSFLLLAFFFLIRIIRVIRIVT